MLRLIESSNSVEVTRFNARAHYNQRVVLTAAVCKELQRAPDDIVGGRVQAALAMLSWWMRTVHDLPEGKDVHYAHGLADPRLAEYASDLKPELELGAAVCDALAMAYTADTASELARDEEQIRGQLNAYLAKFDI